MLPKKRLYSYQINPCLMSQIEKSFEHDFHLIEVASLEELLVWTSSEKLELLIFEEGRLVQKEIELLQFILKSMPQLRVLVLGEGDDLKWCVEMLKSDQVWLERLPKENEEWLRLLYLKTANIDLEKKETPIAGLIQNAISRSLLNQLNLESAVDLFEKEFLNHLGLSETN